MPSLLPDFEYDIFISYRQKDNKGERWVTEFVNVLKTELESTFKEDISIYFDENPHDGLHDHHDVDESLREKVKCLVFIPIVSRTYCDPNSFAWKFEFVAFVEQAKHDMFGLKVKVSNGNVASRVLPIRIHDLEKNDITLFESVSGAVLRPIDFVYKSAGVNRPLHHHEEHAGENQNHIVFRDQINKVANAIGEVISAMKAPSEPRDPRHAHQEKADVTQSATIKPRLKKIMAVALILLVSLAAYYFLVRSVRTLDASQSSIAIIPFRNNTGDESKTLYGVGIASEVSTQLGLTKQFEFISSFQATIQYQQSNEPPQSIGNNLNVTHILTGMYQTAGDNIQVTVELIEVSSGKVLWSLPYRTRYDDVFKLQENIASAVIGKFSASKINSKPPTKNLDAYYHYMNGNKISTRLDQRNRLKAIPEYIAAIQLDSGFLSPWVGIITNYGLIMFNFPDDSTVTKETIDPFLYYVENNFPDSWEKKIAQGNYAYYVMKDYDKGLQLLKGALSENPEAATNIGAIYRRKLMLQEATESDVKNLNRKKGSFNLVFFDFRLCGDMKNAEKVAKKAYDFNHASPGNLYTFKQLQNTLEELPDALQDAFKGTYNSDLLLQKKDFRGLIHHLNSAITDSTFDQASINYYKSIAYYLLRKDDSSRYSAKLFFDNTQENSPLIDKTRRSIEMNSVLGKEEVVDITINFLFSRHNEQDLLDQWTKKYYKVVYLTGSRNFPKANELLKEMNRVYPQIGMYDWLNHPYYDRIKKEYPPFLETISQLKYPPKISDQVKLDW